MKIPKDAILATSYVFERANGNPLGENEISEILAYNLDRIDPDQLAEGLVATILNDAENDPHHRAQAYWALGKRFDRRLLTFFRERLAIELQLDAAAVYQITIALDNLGELVFPPTRNGSHSILDSELNLQDARTYLSGLRSKP